MSGEPSDADPLHVPLREAAIGARLAAFARGGGEGGSRALRRAPPMARRGPARRAQGAAARARAHAPTAGVSGAAPQRSAAPSSPPGRSRIAARGRRRWTPRTTSSRPRTRRGFRGRGRTSPRRHELLSRPARLAADPSRAIASGFTAAASGPRALQRGCGDLVSDSGSPSQKNAIDGSV